MNKQHKVKTSLEDRKKYSEVLTPPSIRQKMLNMIGKSFFSNSNIKVFEPAVGKGYFIADIIDICMTTFTDIPINKRYQHIVERCIYFADINKRNVKHVKKLIDPNNQHKLNYYTGDSLIIDIQKVFNVNHFSLIITNPPFSAIDAPMRGNALYHKFVIKALQTWTTSNGLVSMLLPQQWKAPRNEKGRLRGLFEMMTHQNYMTHLTISPHDKEMDAIINHDIFLIKRAPPKLTKVVDINEKKWRLNLKEWKFLPNCNFKTINKIVSNDRSKTFELIYNNIGYTGPYRALHKIKKDSLEYSQAPKPRPSNKPALLTQSYFPLKRFVVDHRGNINFNTNIVGIVIKNKKEGLKLIKHFKSPKFKAISKCLYYGHRTRLYVLPYIRRDFYKFL